MKKKGSATTWTFSIFMMWVLIMVGMVLMGTTIIRNSSELTSMYGETPSIFDSFSLVVKISTFQVVDIVPYWITLILDGLSVIVIISLIYAARGVS